MSQDSGNPLSPVRLKNGDEVPEVMVKVVMLSLKTLNETYPIAFYELVMACRDREHVLFGNSHEILARLTLIEEIDDTGRPRIHDLTRSIVLSAAEGEELDMRLVSPVAPH